MLFLLPYWNVLLLPILLTHAFEREPCHITLKNENLEVYSNSWYTIDFNSTCCLKYNCNSQWFQNLQYNNISIISRDEFFMGSLFLRVVSTDDSIIRAFPKSTETLDDSDPDAANRPDHLVRNHDHLLGFSIDESDQKFHLHTDHLGRGKISIEIVWCNYTRFVYYWNANKNRHKERNIFNHDIKYSEGVLSEIPLTWMSIDVCVTRKDSILFSAYEWSVIFVAVLTGLSVGCCSEISQWIPIRKKPTVFILALCIQHIFMPLTAVALGLMASLPGDLVYGLLCMGAMPGGGWAHLFVFITEGDAHLSTAISVTNSILNLILSPFWLFIFRGWIYPSSFSFGMMILWLLPVTVSQVGGTILRKWHPNCAEAILTWFTRPCLLLAGILLITLGVYLNQYAFKYVSMLLILCIILLINIGFFVGGFVGWLCKTNADCSKSLAAECSVFNCLTAIPALRYSIAQPEGILASSVPLLGIFCTPIPLVLYYVVKKIQEILDKIMAQRRSEQVQLFVQKMSGNDKQCESTTPPIQLSLPRSTEASMVNHDDAQHEA